MTAAAKAGPGERRVGTDDFPRLAVYKRAGPKGPIYRIVFKNREFGTVREFRVRLAYVILVSLFIPLLIVAGMAAEATGVNRLIGMAVFVLLVLLAMHRAYRAFFVPRTIELDMGEDRLRILKGTRVEIERPRSRMTNLTVEPHPEAEYALRVRQENGDKTLKEVEKQHCLMGWFGPGGGEQVTLLCRAEWPNRNTLFEVRQAMLWTIGQAPEPEEPELVPPAGLNPPLD